MRPQLGGVGSGLLSPTKNMSMPAADAVAEDAREDRVSGDSNSFGSGSPTKLKMGLAARHGLKSPRNTFGAPMSRNTISGSDMKEFSLTKQQNALNPIPEDQKAEHASHEGAFNDNYSD